MTHRFHVGEEVMIRSCTLNGRLGVVKELQAARVYRLHVTEVEGVLLFCEESLVRPHEQKEDRQDRHHFN